MEKLINIGKKEIFLYIIILVVVYVIVNKATKSVTNIFTDNEKKEIDTDNYKAVTRDLKPKNLSYPESAYANWSAILYNAMDGVGTDGEAIETVFEKMKNNDDVRKLIEVFGTPKGDNLFTWLSDDLPRSSMVFTSLNDINEILQKKGITILF